MAENSINDNSLSDAYAEALGMFDMGFVYDDDSYTYADRTCAYHYFAALPGVSVSIYLTRQQIVTAPVVPVVRGIIIEVECGNKWYAPCYSKNKQELLPTVVAEVKLNLLQHLVSIGHKPAVSYLRTHRIDSFLT